MKQLFTQIFVSLGVIFLLLILFAIYFFVADPYELKPLIFGSSAPTFQSNIDSTTGSVGTEGESEVTSPQTDTTASGGFALSEAQKQALVSFGIDPASVPASVSIEQEACFVAALGESRVAEVKAGAVPNALEFYKAKGCI